MNVQQYLKERNRVLGILSKDGNFRVVLVKNTVVAQTAQKRHQLPQIPTMYLAQALTAVSLLSSSLKGEERIAITIISKSSIERIFAEASQVGEVRGYVTFQHEKKSPSKLEGVLRVEKVLYNRFRAPEHTPLFLVGTIVSIGLFWNVFLK